MATIVIDPGHGGNRNLDCSDANHAVGPKHGLLEKDMTLDVALRTRRELERRGHSVALTRDRDINVAGAARANVARDHQADVFVSIHFNASDGHNAQGTETWVHRDAANAGPSADLCRAVQANVVKATGLSDRNRFSPPHFIKKAGFCVLKPTQHAGKTAAVLVEVSFLDRADEEERLLRGSYKDEIAIGIASGIEDHLGVSASPEAVDDGGYEVEDAVALQAAVAGIAVEQLVGTSERRTEGAWKGGHMLADEVAMTEAVTPAAAPSGPARGRGTLRRMAASLMADVPRLLAQPEDDINEFLSTPIGDPPDFAHAARGNTAAFSVVESMFAGPEAEDFDFAAFETFIHSLGLQHFTPVEFLFLGASNQSGTCAGRNSLPPQTLWTNIAKTALMLDIIRGRLGAPVHILSCYRAEAYNACISGAGGSFHKKFNAIDWRCDTGTVTQWRDVARQVRNSDPRFKGGVGFYPASSFIHIDTRGENRDW